MADVFIAYSQENRAEAAQLANLLQAQGYSTWWDVQLFAGANFDEVIQRELEAARVAIVLWTESSVKSRWVRAEANFAAQRKILLPVILGKLQVSQLPIEFSIYQTLVLASADDPKIIHLFEAIGQLTGRFAENEQQPAGPRSSPVHKADEQFGENASAPWVFVSHVDTDKPRIRPYVERLLESGLNVFIDKPAKLGLDKKWIGSTRLNYIRYFDNYRVAISQALENSGCILVFWSTDSVQTERQRFWDEVEFGSVNGFLVSTMIDDVIGGAKKIPKGYGFSQANIADLTSEEALNAEFDWVVADIKKLISEYGAKLKLQSASGGNHEEVEGSFGAARQEHQSGRPTQ